MIARKSFALLLPLLAAFALVGCGRSPELSLPKQSDSKVILKPGGAEQIRFVTRKPDGSSEVRIEYTDNRSALEIRRGDDTIAEVKVWYPAAKNSSTRQLQRHILFDADGKTFLSNVEYYPNGKLAKQGSTFGGSTIYESYSFRPDGHTVLRHQRFVKTDKWQAVFDETYGDNNSVLSSLAVQPDGSTVVTTWNDKGVKASSCKTDSYGANITTEYYYPDGVAVYKLVEQGTYSTTVTLKRFDGTPIVKREVNAGQLQTFYYNEKGEPFYKQTFTVDKLQTPDGGTVSRYRLTWAAETDTKDNVLRSIYFADDGVTPKTVTVYNQPANTGRVDKTYAADGTLAKVEVYDASSKIIATTNHTPSENLREKLPPRLMQLETFDRPPAPTGKSTFHFEPYDFD